MKLSNNDLTVIEHIKKSIMTNEKTSKIFSHHKQKYSIDELLKNVFIVLKNGISFREITNYTDICWNTVYKFFIKLTKNNIINQIYKNSINMYLTKINKSENKKYLYIDTTIIPNKLGINDISINPQLKKHKSSKISVIIDDYEIPIDCNVYKSSINDAKITDMQINDIVKNYPLLCSNNNILIGDAAYDSNNIRDKLKNLKIGKLLTPKNKRNTKNKIKNQKLDFTEKMILNKRISVEHTINRYKQFKRLNNRYDKKSKNFQTFLFIASLLIFNSKTHIL